MSNDYQIFNEIEKGNIENIQSFIDKGYILNETHISYASSCGQLDVLKFLHNLGCPWNYLTTSSASSFGHLNCLKYAIENGCDYTYALRNATLYGMLDCIRYLVEEKGEFVDLITVELSAQSGNLNCIKYFHKRKAPFKESVLKVAKDARKKKVQEYLINTVGLHDSSNSHF